MRLSSDGPGMEGTFATGATRVLPSLGPVSETRQHRIDVALQSCVALADCLLKLLIAPSFAQGLELSVEVEDKRWM
jgi:hypothetical protein